MSIISNHSNKFSNKVGVTPSDFCDSNEVDYIVGDKVYIASNPEKTGIVTYNGVTKFSDGIWIGVALDQPLGKHNGIVQGVTYFQCDEKHGIFVRKNNLRHIKDKPEFGIQLNNSNLLKNSDDYPFFVPDPIMDIRSNFFLGDKVCVIGKSSSSTQKIGTLRFIGNTKFAEGIWVGIELDNPIGRNDGSVEGVRYFSCKSQYGLFALENKVQKYGSIVSRSIKTNNRMDNQSRYGSNESISSVASNFSSASRTRVRLGMTALNSTGRPKGDKLYENSSNKIKNINTISTNKDSKDINQGSNAFQKVLKEKEQHVEQLIREREIERIDLASATSKIEELEFQLSRQINAFNEQNLLFEKKLMELQENNNLINHEKEKLSEKLEEEKKKTDDLLFQIEEKNIDESDLENKTEESEHHIFELNEKLAHEKDLREALEIKLNELTNNFKCQSIDNSALKEIEALQLKIQNLEKELNDKRDSKVSSMLKVIEEKDSVINDIQDRYENIKYKLEQSLFQIKNMNNEMMSLKTSLNEESTKNKNLESIKEQLENDKVQLTNVINKQNEKFDEFSKKENEYQINFEALQKENKKFSENNNLKFNENENEKIIKRYENEIEKLKKQLESEKTAISNAELIIKSNNQLLSEKNSELMDLIQKINHLEVDYTNQTKLKQNAITEKDNMCAELAANIDQLEKLRIQITNIHDEKNSYIQQLTKKNQIELNLKQEINELKDKTEFLEKENRILNENLNTSENSQNNISNSKVELLNKIENLESKVQELNISLKSEKDANMEYITKNATLHSDLEEMRQKQDDFNNLRFEIENLQTIISQLETEKMELVENFELKNQELMVIRERLLSISQEFENLQESHKNLSLKFDREKRISTDKIRKLEKQLDEPDKKSQFSHSDSLSEKRKSDGKDQVNLLKAAKDNAEEQISFLNLVIVEREKKFKTLESENENLRNKLKDFENGNSCMNKIKKIIPPRLYCDVCEMFDFHDTDQCPKAVNSSGQSSPIIKVRQETSYVKAPRLYCDICEVFDLHNTSDCQDEQTF